MGNISCCITATPRIRGKSVHAQTLYPSTLAVVLAIAFNAPAFSGVGRPFDQNCRSSSARRASPLADTAWTAPTFTATRSSRSAATRRCFRPACSRYEGRTGQAAARRLQRQGIHDADFNRRPTVLSGGEPGHRRDSAGRRRHWRDGNPKRRQPVREDHGRVRL